MAQQKRILHPRKDDDDTPVSLLDRLQTRGPFKERDVDALCLPDAPDTSAIRTCLTCGRAFKSSWIGRRRCDPCNLNTRD